MRSDEMRFLLRVFAGLNELDGGSVLEILGLRRDDPRLDDVEVETGPSASPARVLIKFRNGSEPFEEAEGEKWGMQAFRSAASWLRERTPEQFESVRRLGHHVDFLVVDYDGHLPPDLLGELARLGTGLVTLHSE